MNLFNYYIVISYDTGMLVFNILCSLDISKIKKTTAESCT
jgi:hypothetical protein